MTTEKMHQVMQVARWYDRLHTLSGETDYLLNKFLNAVNLTEEKFITNEQHKKIIEVSNILSEVRRKTNEHGAALYCAGILDKD